MKLTTSPAAAAALLVAALILGSLADRVGAAVVRKVDGTTVTGALVSLEDGTLTVAAGEKDAAQPPAIRLEDVLEVTAPSDGSSPATAPAAAAAPATAPQPRRRPTMRIVKPASRAPDNAPAPSAAPATSASAATTQPVAAATTQPAAPTSYQLELAGSGRLRGRVEAWSDQHVRFAPAVLDGTTVTIPIAHVRAVWSGSSPKVADAQAMQKATAADPVPAAADVAYVLRDDKVHAVPGVALGIDGEALRFRYEGEDRRIALGRLVGVALAAQDEPPEAAAFHQSLRLAADEALPGTWTGIDGESPNQTLALRTLWGEDVAVPASKVSTIAFRNGRLVYLSDLTPAAAEQVPYFDRVIPYRTDQSLTGTPLRLSDGPTTRGVAVHARCVLHYNLSGKFDAFQSKLGFQHPDGRDGRADVRLLGDGMVLFEKLDARGDQPPIDVNVPLRGVNRLTLEVDFGPDEDVGDRVVWGDAKLTRPTVAAPSAAPTR